MSRVQLSLSELKLHDCTRMHLKSNAQAKGGVLSYRNLEVRSSWPKVCTCARDSVEAVTWKRDEIKDSRPRGLGLCTSIWTMRTGTQLYTCEISKPGSDIKKMHDRTRVSGD